MHDARALTPPCSQQKATRKITDLENRLNNVSEGGTDQDHEHDFTTTICQLCMHPSPACPMGRHAPEGGTDHERKISEWQSRLNGTVKSEAEKNADSSNTLASKRVDDQMPRWCGIDVAICEATRRCEATRALQQAQASLNLA